jgi:2-dehydro-3-deoxygluconokinase
VLQAHLADLHQRVGLDAEAVAAVGRDLLQLGGRIDADRPTGLMLRNARMPARTRVSYYRSGSAASTLSSDDLVPALAQRPRIVHATGITPALSPSAEAATIDSLQRAHAAGAITSYDVNWRSRLTDVGAAANVLRAVLPFLRIVFCSEDELPVLAAAVDLPGATLDDLLSLPLDAELVIKRGRQGAVALIDGTKASVEAVPVDAVDVVGAGDAFAAGYLSAHLDGLPVEARLHRAAALGAFCVGADGDWEGLPTRDELALLDASPDFTDR